MFKNSIVFISMLVLSVSSVGNTSSFYPSPYYNSGVKIVDVKEVVMSSGQEPEQSVMPMIPPDHVLVGVGLGTGAKGGENCTATLCTVHLHSRAITGKGELSSDVETHMFGLTSSTQAQPVDLELIIPGTIAVVGIGVRVAKRAVVRIDLKYRTINSDGTLSSEITESTVGSEGSLDKQASASAANKVLTGMGISQASSAVSSLWIYEGTFLQ